MSDLRVIDNDRDEIIITMNGKQLRGWSYGDDTERRVKMLCAREYVEGWHDAKNILQVATRKKIEAGK